MQNKKAFSILEIVVLIGISLLIINIAFSYYKIQLKNTRDSQRTTDINELQSGLEDILTQESILPSPAMGINITASGEVINIQGNVDNTVIVDSSSIVDPLDNTNYTYVVNKDRDRFQLMGLLENNWYENDSVYFEKRLPFTTGKDLGVFMDSDTYTPVQDYLKQDIETSDNLDDFIVYINDHTSAVGTDIKKEIKFRINPIANCLHILKSGDGDTDGIYTISPDKINSFKVYCDMTTDGGGWTLFYANNGIADSPISESYVEMRKNVFEGKQYDLTNYTGSTLAGLKDFRDFTYYGATEILLKNNASIENKGGILSFNSPSNLEWALSDKVLGEGIKKCIDIPEGGYWSVKAVDGTENYMNLKQIFTNGGGSLGISHNSVICNGYEKLDLLQHVAFYTSNNSSYDARTRSPLLIGGTWGGENQYRYFIR